MTKVRLTADLCHSDGETRRGLARRVAEGELQRVRRGAYAAGSAPDVLAEHRRRAEAVLRQRPDAVLAGMSAAALLRLPVLNPELETVRVISTHGHGYRAAGVRQHRYVLDEADRGTVGPLAVTSPARTVVDVARYCGLEWGLIVADAALHRGLCEEADISAAIARADGVRWLGRARRVLELADARAESPLESISRLQMLRLGIPEPQLQYAIVLPDGGLARCDFAWPEFGVVGECDGLVKYGADLAPDGSAEAAILAEKRRENGLRERGWWVVRWLWADAWDLRRIERILRAGLAKGARRPA